MSVDGSGCQWILASFIWDEENEWDNAIHKIINFKSSHETPISTDYSVGGLSHQNVNISWMKPNECVDGYRISVYEIRHLPNLLLQYVDEKNEPKTEADPENKNNPTDKIM